MPIHFKVDAGLKGVRVEIGSETRNVGLQTDQTVLQEKDLQAAKRKLDVAGHAIKETFGNAKAKISSMLPSKDKVEVVKTPA